MCEVCFRESTEPVCLAGMRGLSPCLCVCVCVCVCLICLDHVHPRYDSLPPMSDRTGGWRRDTVGVSIDWISHRRCTPASIHLPACLHLLLDSGFPRLLSCVTPLGTQTCAAPAVPLVPIQSQFSVHHLVSLQPKAGPQTPPTATTVPGGCAKGERGERDGRLPCVNTTASHRVVQTRFGRGPDIGMGVKRF